MTINVGVIGVGAIGREHIARLGRTKGAKVVAATDINVEATQQFLREKNAQAEVYADAHSLINADEVQAVLVTSWGPTHEEYVLAAIAAGKPVFCEKPLAVTEEGCRRIVEAEIAAGKRLVQVGYMRRYDQSYRQLKATLDNDVIGEPLIVKCAHRNPEAPGFEGDMALTDSVVHEVDVLRWLVDDEFKDAQVILPRKTRLLENNSLSDPHVILLNTRKGIHIAIESFVFCQYGYDIQCEVVGEKGISSLADPAACVTRTKAGRSSAILDNWKDRFYDAFDVEFQEWINALLEGGEPKGPSAWDGYVVAAVIDTCIKAKHSGQIEPITLPEKPAFYR